jgi:hypothetical protein
MTLFRVFLTVETQYFLSEKGQRIQRMSATCFGLFASLNVDLCYKQFIYSKIRSSYRQLLNYHNMKHAFLEMIRLIDSSDLKLARDDFHIAQLIIGLDFLYIYRQYLDSIQLS